MARRPPLRGPGGPQAPQCRPWRRNKREGQPGRKGASERASERRPGDQTHVARKKEALDGSEGEGWSQEREWWREKKREKRTENPHPSRGLLRDLLVLSVQTEHPWKPAVRFQPSTSSSHFILHIPSSSSSPPLSSSSSSILVLARVFEKSVKSQPRNIHIEI